MLKNGSMLNDRYEIVGVVGSGGMSDVYKAKCHKLNRYVAIKVLKKEFSDDKNFVAKFRAEAQSAAGLAHANIVNIYDVGEEAGLHYIVMELVEGITLKDYIKNKGRLSVREATSIALQISAGLEAAHNNGIVHRDVKPQNIMISTDGKVKVADFGIARATSAQTINSGVMGSVHYSSPEQSRGGYSDEKSDIYSLGITLYEMLTGKVPFDGDTAVAVAIRHLQEELHSPKELVPEVPHSTNQIVVKCTQKSPDRRYSNMAEVIRDLRESLVNPDGDFVVQQIPDRTSQTIIMSKDEIGKINAEKKAMPSYDESLDTGAAAALHELEKENSQQPNRAYQPGSYYQKSQFQGVHTGRGDAYEPGRGFEADPMDPMKEYDPYYDAYANPDDYAIHEGKKEAGYRLDESFVQKKETRHFLDDDDTEVGLNPKLEKIVTVGGIIVAVIIGCVFLALLANAFGLLDFTKKQKKEEFTTEKMTEAVIETESQTELQPVTEMTMTEAPQTEAGFELSDLSNVEQNQAQAFLLTQGLQCKVENTFSDTVDSGYVVSTSPAAGSPVKQGDMITVYVSQGVETEPEPVSYVQLWSLTGYTRERAQEALDMLDLVGDFQEGPSDTIAPGMIVSQTPPSTEQIPRGSTVTLIVSTGPSASASAPENTAENSQSASQETVVVQNGTAGTWKCDAQLVEPAGYNGQSVRITLVQNGVESTIFEGTTTFPYRLTVQGASGVETGVAYIYLLDASTGEVSSKIEYPGITFTNVAG